MTDYGSLLSDWEEGKFPVIERRKEKEIWLETMIFRLYMLQKYNNISRKEREEKKREREKRRRGSGPGGNSEGEGGRGRGGVGLFSCPALPLPAETKQHSTLTKTCSLYHNNINIICNNLQHLYNIYDNGKALLCYSLFQTSQKATQVESVAEKREKKENKLEEKQPVKMCENNVRRRRVCVVRRLIFSGKEQDIPHYLRGRLNNLIQTLTYPYQRNISSYSSFSAKASLSPIQGEAQRGSMAERHASDMSS